MNQVINPEMQERLGSAYRYARVTDAQVLEICARYDAGESAPQIAKDYPISAARILQIVNGRAWTCVTGRAPKPIVTKPYLKWRYHK